jgi:hypothetical protein
MKKIIILLTIGIIQLGFSQNKKEIEVGDFSKLSVYDKIEVTLVSSDKNKVEITGNDIDNVSVVNKNGSLKIKMNLVNSFQGDNVKATLYYKKLDQITAESGSSIKGSDRIKAVSLDVNAKNGSTINLIVDSERLNVKAGSGSIAQLSGKASVQDVLSNSDRTFLLISWDLSCVKVGNMPLHLVVQCLDHGTHLLYLAGSILSGE